MNDEKQKLIGRRIRTAREEAGLSQEQLGRKVGYSAMGISHLENGDRKIKLEDLQLVADTLGLEISFLLEPITQQAAYSGSFFGRRGQEDITDEQKKAEQNAMKKLDDFLKGL